VALQLAFEAGTLTLRGWSSAASLPEAFVWDDRAALYRAPALAYAEIVTQLTRSGISYEDQARGYTEFAPTLHVQREPRPFQLEALSAWRGARHRGVVVLPTGAGKSHVAVLAIADRKRSTLVVAPTLDLVRQWASLLSATFGCEVGLIGGGEFSVLPLTVSTYDSAYLHMDRIGHRFGLLVFDEAHHLPSESYALAARASLAPFRLGLTATPTRADGKDALLDELIGVVVYQRTITELSGQYLAEYRTERLSVELSAEERQAYQEARDTYLGFVRSQGLRLGSPQGFRDFIMRGSRSEAGRRAVEAYRLQRSLALSAAGKMRVLEHLLDLHRQERSLVFTEDNRTAYEISRRFLIPVITHQTKLRERVSILEGLAQGRYTAVVTSKVLNEGVDVPTASVAIVLSGSGSVMEHVQRLGRILRQQEGKQAVLYELVSAQTVETYTSERRREHVAYKKRPAAS